MKGVSFDNKSQKFRAYLSVGGERWYLGFFQTEQEAIEKRKEIEQIYFDKNGMLTLESKFNRKQLYALYLDYLSRFYNTFTFKHYVFSDKKLNPIPLTALPKFNNPNQEIAFRYLINGNSLDSIARFLNVTKYDLIVLLKPVINLSEK